MTTIAEFEIDTSSSALGTVFSNCDGLHCSVEQVIAAADRGLWFEGVDRHSLEAALEADPTVESFTLIATDDTDGRMLYDVSIADEALDIFEQVLSHRGTVLTAAASNGWWHVRVRFLDHGDASSLYERLDDSEATVTLRRLTELKETSSTTDRLTDKQYETLLAALDQGYFTIPRETSMEELADELGISHQALSERFRRAYRALVMTELNGASHEGGEKGLESERPV